MTPDPSDGQPPAAPRLRAWRWVAAALALVALLGARWWVAARGAARADYLAYLDSRQAEAFFRAGEGAHARALVAAAAQGLGVAHPSATLTGAQGLAALAVGRLARLVVMPVPGSAAGWLTAAAALLLLAWTTWRGDRALARERAVRAQWERRWAAEAGAALPTLSDAPGIKVVLAQVLDQLVGGLDLQEALLLKWHRDRPLDALELYAFSGKSPGREWGPVPLAHVGPAASGVGRTLATGEPWFRDWSRGAAEPLLPLYSPRGAAAYPVRVEEATWGVLVLVGDRPRWPTADPELVGAARRQIENLLTHLTVRVESDRYRAYQEAARLQSELLGHVSHELRTPMGLIRGYARTLLRDGDRLPAAERTEFLEVIAEESERLAGLVDNLLKMAALEGGDGTLRMERLDLHALVEAAVERFPPGQRTRVSRAVAEGLLVHGDREGLGQVVANLLDNALKYSSGRVDLRAEVTGSMLELSVRDFGPGVPLPELPRIFDRFYRGEVARRLPAVRGTGLGLGIARRVVEAHHGEIRAENAPGGGLVVAVRLPLGGREP